MTTSEGPSAPPRPSRTRRALVVLGAACVGAGLGAAAFLAVLHDPMGLPPPDAPSGAASGWSTLFNAGFGLFGAVVGGGVGAGVGLAVVLWGSRQRRAV